MMVLPDETPEKKSRLVYKLTGLAAATTVGAVILTPIVYGLYLFGKASHFAFKYPKTTVAGVLVGGTLAYSAYNNDVGAIAEKIYTHYQQTSALEEKLEAQQEQYETLLEKFREQNILGEQPEQTENIEPSGQIEYIEKINQSPPIESTEVPALSEQSALYTEPISFPEPTYQPSSSFSTLGKQYANFLSGLGAGAAGTLLFGLGASYFSKKTPKVKGAYPTFNEFRGLGPKERMRQID